ncbi:hypothetical protein HK098_007409, partial [Nowakowskiella sp. JEL0407]
YLTEAAKQIQSKGAKVYISGPTPRNSWDATGTTVSACNRFCDYAKTAADLSGAVYIDHNGNVAKLYEQLGKATVSTFYSDTDALHTSKDGAVVVAKAYVIAAVCGGWSGLKSYLTSDGLDAVKGCSPVASTTSFGPSPSVIPKPVSPSPVPTSPSPSPSPSPVGSCQALYAQCGGKLFQGETRCCAGLTCVYASEWVKISLYIGLNAEVRKIKIMLAKAKL